MNSLHVCSLARLEEVAASSGARRLISLLSPLGVKASRPPGIAPADHLVVGVSDIVEPKDGFTHPEERHVLDILRFFKDWDRTAPLLIHCYAGVSRSTAAAFIGLCLLMPEQPEQALAARLRQASPTATPNLRLVELADGLLHRSGRMVDAVRGIGRGADCFEGAPFSIPVTAS